MTAVHQFHPVLAPGDAMSDHVFALRARFREWGYASEAYAVEAKPGVDGETRSYRELFRSVRPEDTLVLHFSMGHEVFDELAKLPARRVLVFHNVTPPEFFVGLNPHAAAHARLGIRQLQRLAPSIDLAVGVSEFNRRALEAAGYARTACVPILVDWSRYAIDPDAEVRALLAGIHSKLLFVGRISPNKRQDELIRMLAYYRRCIDPEAILVLVGSHRDQPQYYARLRALADALGVASAVRFTGPVSLPQLVAYYRAASCFVSLSEHEGFGVPLLEAMFLGAPVVALDAAAVGETVDGAAVLLPRKDLAEAAEACALVNEDLGWRAALVDAGHERVRAFDPDRTARRTKDVLGL
ncbi:MAG TPA: glycosyltransferase family 4 protein [Candidatus Limnocylindria bacterium]|nr:glycosyltransferase family 4 protein [Candidatus Limnocylindria bacterium]